MAKIFLNRANSQLSYSLLVKKHSLKSNEVDFQAIRQYENDSILSKKDPILKLPRFYTIHRGMKKRGNFKTRIIFDRMEWFLCLCSMSFDTLCALNEERIVQNLFEKPRLKKKKIFV